MKFKDDNKKWVDDQIKAANASDPYWHHVKLAYNQLGGLIEGYNKVNNNKSIPENGIMLLNLWHDMEDLSNALKVKHGLDSLTFPDRIQTRSCSALIKVVEEELYFGHVTWSLYNRMLRIMKKYDFDFRETLQKGQENMPGRVTVFSGYPGVTVSGNHLL